MKIDICVNDLSVSFPGENQELPVLRHVEIMFPEKKITAVVGESGSGKSILGEAVMRLLDPSANVTGIINYGKQNLLELSEKEMNQIRGFHIGWIAQDPVSAMNPMVKIGKQLTEAIRFKNHRKENEEKEAALNSLHTFGFSHPDTVYQNYPCELSGGMAQRIMTSMMMMPRPEWLIADEPTKGLDVFGRSQVAKMFRKLRDRGTGIFLITHDLHLASKIADYTAVMYAGEILEYGKTKEIMECPGHPYTKGLLGAMPENGLVPIPGKPPDLTHCPEGCIFGPRCSRFLSPQCLSHQKFVGTKEHLTKCCRKEGQ